MYLCRLPSVVVLAAALLPSALPAQQPPRAAVAGAPMLATDRFLFVQRGSVLYQLDIEALKLLHSFDFAQAGTPRAVTPGEVVRVEVKEEPGEKPQEAQARIAAGMAVGRAVDLALDWLAAHQDEDGHWDADQFMKHDPKGKECDGPGNPVHDVGITGLAMLAMLGDGNTLRAGPYKDNLKRAAGWLRAQQQPNGLSATKPPSTSSTTTRSPPTRCARPMGCPSTTR
jgi:hypothetical protein